MTVLLSVCAEVQSYLKRKKESARMPSATQESSGLKVGIVGAGVAGLCAAIALRRAGHECEVGSQRCVKTSSSNHYPDLREISIP